ncbi:signal peptidase I [Agathobacter rectalis]|uniref:Signal peptidase I n=1 Tax=Agathobacter rectalis TaxID=39491 RepID=A0A414A6Y4_9FIRM|nr:signal peptidase I [Agathobacter rectalis]RGR62240.1 signal peptidase I [Agathobacter rectalis]RGS05738.1 signal peptidase I [Agathobacter rectalis]RHC41482.1 signal peptidase I [Agathobacter rectalis]
MIEKIYKKAIYALARVAVKYIELRKKREQKKIRQNKSANLINSTNSFTDAEYNKKAVAEIHQDNDAAIEESKNNIDVVDLSKDEELKDVEHKPLTNEDKLDLLLAQMMQTPEKSSEKVTQVHKQNQNVDDNISQEQKIEEIIPVKYVTPAPDITIDIEKNIEIEKEYQQTKKESQPEDISVHIEKEISKKASEDNRAGNIEAENKEAENKSAEKTEDISGYRSIMTDDYDRYSDDLGIKELRQELRRVKYNNKFAATLFNTVGTLVVVAAAAILVANLWLPILKVTGTSMSPTLQEGQVLMASKGHDFKTGDVIAFYYNNKILVKRVIAMPGDWVNISDDGTVYVNDIAIDEPYLKEKALGDCNIELPYQVPESKIFVMGDNRSVSLDSRNTAIGCVSEEQVVGRIAFAIWPLSKIGKIG